MQFTPEYQFPCLGPDDYAAYATYMQCLADDLDAKFTETSEAMDAVRNTYAAVWRNTTTLTPDGSGAYPGLTTISNLFWNDPNNTPTTGSGTSSDPVRYQFPGMVPGGLYEVGGTVLFNTGATANSTRQFQMFVYFDATQGITSSAFVNDVTEESSTGGESLRGDAQIALTLRDITPGLGNFGIPIGFYLNLFENDAGTPTVLAGNLTFWAVLIGTNTLIGGA